jgi:predicted enzyme related to lactoylglutathione lyase
MKPGQITRLWLTMIRVADIEVATHFYTNILGLPLALDAREFNHMEIGPREPLAKIGLFATGKKTKRKKRTGIVLDTDDIYALYQRLIDHDVQFTLKPTQTPWGGIMACFLDPDHNELQIVQDPEHYNRDYSK